jgi:menaquinone-dependent protoporphyrinogen oxidase
MKTVVIYASKYGSTKGIAEFIKPRDHQVFFGVLDSSKLGFGHRMLRKLPAARKALPEGDFRDWNEIEAWAISIARVLETSQATPGSNKSAQGDYEKE